MESKLPSDRFYVDSAGTANYHIGSPPDKRSVSVAKKYGIDISMQRGRQFKHSDFEDFDIIFTMDSSNYVNVVRIARTQTEAGKVKMLLEETDLGVAEVPDPYYGNDSGFEDVYHLLDKACTQIAKRLL